MKQADGENKKKNTEDRDVARRRCEMTDALNKAIATLCESSEENFEEVLSKSLHHFASVMGAGRILVYQNVEVDGEIKQKQLFLYEIAIGGIRSSHINYLPDGPALRKWRQAGQRNEYINLCLKTATPDEVAYLTPFGIKSILIIPILTSGQYWGTIIFGDLEKERLFDEDCMDLILSGSMIYTSAIIRDSMKQNLKKSFNEMATQNMRLNLLVDSMGVALWDMDIPTDRDPFKSENAFWWSDEFRHLLGFKDENDFPNVHGSWSERIHPEDKERVFAAVAAHMYDLSGKTPFDIEYRIMNKKGKYRYFRAFGETHRDKDGNPLKIAGALEDIHAKKQMLRDIDNMRTQKFISKFSVPFTQPYVFDELINNALFELRDYTETDRAIILEFLPDGRLCCTYESIINEKTPSVLGHMLPYEDEKPLLDEAEKRGCFYEKDAALYFKKHPQVNLGEKSFCYIPLMIEGERAGYLAFFTMFKQADWGEDEFRLTTMAGSIVAGAFSNRKNDMLKEETLKAQQESKAKSNFLSVMSHEMRTPLNAIIGMTTIAKETQDLERKDYALKRIEQASVSLLGIITDTLDMAKIEADKFELSPVEFNVEKMLQNVISIVKFYMDEKNQKFDMYIDENMPRFIISDNHRLSQVVSNLLSNACKFTSNGGKIHLSVSLENEENGICELRFEVTDSGIGISPEQQKKLFQAFLQAESGISRTFGGTGLGLALCKRIVELMEGKIWVHSEMGKGARFVFTIKAPRGKQLAKNKPAPSPQQREKAAAGEFSGKKMLLAEDVEINREIVKMLLDGMGLIIEEAENGQKAYEKIKNNPEEYSIVFMDMQMPKMDGLEATRQIRALPYEYTKRLPIIAMTANVFVEDIEKCLAAGMNSHIGKPLKKDEILTVLETYLV
ncbi:MAG: ATP-binding protein [Oscillospiraceae bacterium]|nr:ATP-binding protein [Oscillospiraceae bacterium]